MSLIPPGQNLRIGLFRFTLVPRLPLAVPAVNKGNMLRGGFGHAFRKLCCIPQCTLGAPAARFSRDEAECRSTPACPLGETCPYKQIFAPSPPPGSERLSKNQDIPRPFVFRPPLTTQTTFQKDEPFEFELILIGRALDFLPYFVLSFRELADGGLGLNRARCILDRVVELGLRRNNAALGEQSNLSGSGKGGTESEPQPPFASGASESVPRSSPSGGAEPGPWQTGGLSIQSEPRPLGNGGPEATVPHHWPDLVTRPIYRSSDQIFHTPQGITAGQWIEARLQQLSPGSSSGAPSLPPGGIPTGQSAASSAASHSPLTSEPAQTLPNGHSYPAEGLSTINIRFLTPTLLKVNGKIIRKPEFHHIFKRLRDRLNALCTFYGDGPLDVDFHALGKRAEAIQTISANFHWTERYRTSSRTGQRHELSGFMGVGLYVGELGEFLPWLVIGELSAIGRHAAFGCGAFSIK